MNLLIRSAFLFVGASIAFISCETESEDARFEAFLVKHQKMYAMHFPEGQYNLADSNFVKQLTDSQVFEDVQFCNAQLDQLARFNLENLSEINQSQLKIIFSDMKGRLAEIENWSNSAAGQPSKQED